MTKEGLAGQLAQESCWPEREHTCPHHLPGALQLGPTSLPSAASKAPPTPAPLSPGLLFPEACLNPTFPNEVALLSLLPQLPLRRT